jgi:NAD(P)-dependent dehydrogenase (short-subunit alcohol dehydrogenase family)
MLSTFLVFSIQHNSMICQAQTEMRPRDGSIVLIASATAYQASKAQYLADYCSSKGAVILWPENWV